MALTSVSAEPIADDSALDLGKPAIREPSTDTQRAAETPRVAQRIRRWFWMYRGKFRAAAIGLVALLLFLVAWHLLTTYRVNIYVRFLNVPSPEQVLDRAIRAAGDPKFFSHVMLSCRRILFGFLIAALIAVPLGLVMGRFRLFREFVFPITEVFRPIPAIAWVPMAIMLWPTNEESIVFITFLGSFFPILLNTLHGMSLVDPVLVRAAESLGAKALCDVSRGLFPGDASAHLHRPYHRDGCRLGVADRRRDDLRPIRHRLFHLGSLFARPVFRHRTRHDLHRCAGPGVERADPGRRPSCHAVEQIMSEAIREAMGAPAAARVKSGLIEIKDFNLNYETMDGTVEAVTDVDVRVEPGEFVSIIGPSGCGKVDLAQRCRRLPEADQRHSDT